jgi:hypothetical protein
MVICLLRSPCSFPLIKWFILDLASPVAVMIKPKLIVVLPIKAKTMARSMRANDEGGHGAMTLSSSTQLEWTHEQTTPHVHHSAVKSDRRRARRRIPFRRFNTMVKTSLMLQTLSWEWISEAGNMCPSLNPSWITTLVSYQGTHLEKLITCHRLA